MLLVGLGWTTTVSGEQAVVRIEVDAPPACPGAHTFYERVRARTQRVRLAKAEEPALELRVRIVKRASRVHGELRGVSERGATDVHRVDGVSCQEVIEALSLTVALALDPQARLSAPSPAEDSASSKPPSNSQASEGSEARAEGSSNPVLPAEPGSDGPLEEQSEGDDPAFRAHGLGVARGYELVLGAQGALAEVVSSRWNTGAGLFVRLDSSGDVLAPSLGVALRHLRNDLWSAPESVFIGWTTVALSACPVRWNWGAIRLQPCAVGIGGWLDASGRSISQPKSALRTWWSAGGLVRAAWELGERSALELELAGTLPLIRRRFVLEVPGRLIAETPRVSMLASVGVGFTL